MYSSAGAVKRIAVFGALPLLAFWVAGVMYTTPVAASSTSVDARVCSESVSSATITIDEPESDSVVDQKTVTLQGQVTDVSQIDVRVDGDYSHTVAIGKNQTSYQTDVSLPGGTHTIEVIGSDICNVEDPTAAVVITVKIDTPPSTGEDTPTVINPDVPRDSGGGGVTVTDGTPTGEPVSDETGEAVGPLLPPVIEEIIQVTDLDTIAQDGAMRGVVRGLLFFVGAAFLVAGSSLFLLLIGWIKQRAVTSMVAKQVTDIGVRFTGLILIAAALVI